MTSPSQHRRAKRRAPWAAYLWPGLPHLWIRGSWAGLLLAVGFTALLHTTVLATLVWPEWLPPRVVMGCGATLGLLWLAALWETRGELRRLSEERAAAEQLDEQTDEAGGADDSSAESQENKTDALFAESQTKYLEADWAAAERLLLELLRIDRDDAEAGLLLATLWRRIGRTGDASRRLRQLARREAADPWRFEIDAELALCEPLATEVVDPEPVGVRTDPVAGTNNEEQPPQSAEPLDPRPAEPWRADRNAA